MDHGEGRDLLKPFALKIDMTEAKRANTAIDDAMLQSTSKTKALRVSLQGTREGALFVVESINLK